MLIKKYITIIKNPKEILNYHNFSIFFIFYQILILLLLFITTSFFLTANKNNKKLYLQEDIYLEKYNVINNKIFHLNIKEQNLYKELSDVQK